MKLSGALNIFPNPATIFEKIFFSNSDYIFIESESKRVGHVLIPNNIYDAIVRDGYHILLECSLENRVKRLCRDYVYNKDENNLEVFKSLKKGQEILVNNYEIKEAETTPPSRYNSGSLILAMENAGKLIEDEELREQIKGAGIGTSATRGEIIKKLEKIKYIDINSKTQIVTPTQKGEAIYDVVNFSMPDMLNAKLTASWEKGLDLVAKKEIKPDEFMTKLVNYINSKFNKLIVKK